MKMKKILPILVIMIGLFCGCNAQDSPNNRREEMKQWVENANLYDHATREELYQSALDEDTLVIYSVSSRVFDTKKSFEKEYPGLTVEIKDIRGGDVVDMVLSNYEKGDYTCDLVICSDCDGSLFKELIEPGILYPYIPWDLESNIKEDHKDREVLFLGEALMLFYNNEVFDAPPIHNIWELTDDNYKGKIIMASPLSSFSTYGFCTATFTETEAMKKSYEDYFKQPISVPKGKNIGEIFWEMVVPNIVFTNSSDEVLEGIGGNGEDGMWIGLLISSKMRFQDLGYNFSPIYHLTPFSAVYTPNSVTIAGGSKNINTAKLFIRYMMGETDGTGEGAIPFNSIGTWSTRIDVPDGNPVPLEDIDIVNINKEYIYDNREKLREFFKYMLQENVNQ